jgi:hypothetical protein
MANSVHHEEVTSRIAEFRFDPDDSGIVLDNLTGRDLTMIRRGVRGLSADEGDHRLLRFGNPTGMKPARHRDLPFIERMIEILTESRWGFALDRPREITSRWLKIEGRFMLGPAHTKILGRAG